MTTWTREHDAVIARECEGLDNFFYGEVFKDNLYHQPKEDKLQTFEVSRYSTDLSACFRAAEAWKNVDIDRRCYSVTSAGNAQPTAMCWISPHSLRGEHIYHGHDEEMAGALAWALYNAVKGTK